MSFLWHQPLAFSRPHQHTHPQPRQAAPKILLPATQAPSRGPETAYLQRRTVELRHESGALEARREIDSLQSSDNALFFRMVAPGLGLTERVMLCSWTALGEWRLEPHGGRDAAGREYSRQVGCFLATSTAYEGVVVVRCRAGAAACTHPGLTLPNDATVLAAFEPFDGTASHAAVLYPNAVNLTDAATMLTWTSQAKMLFNQFEEELLAVFDTLAFSYGALNDVSTPLLPRRLRRFACRPDGAPPGGFETGPAEGLVAFSKRIHHAQWNDQGTALRPARIHPTAPVAEDSLSRAGQSAVVIEEGFRHNQVFPGFFNRLPEGDGHRVGHQADVGTERVTNGLLKTAREAVHAALLDESDAASVKFETVAAAKAKVQFLSMLCVPDHLHAPMHNGMALVKAFLVPHWKVASLDQIKSLLGFSGIRPSKEGESYRLKRRLLRVFMLAYSKVLLRRFHTTPGSLDRVKKLADGRTLDEADYLERVRRAPSHHARVTAR